MNSKTRTYFFWAALIVVQAVWIMHSDGFYFIDDSSHFNFNRHYLESVGESTGAWHRMGRVLLYALPAQFGLKGVQIASALLFLATIFFAYKILKAKNVKYAEWVIPIIGFQPVLFNISYTSLAELPAAFLIVLSCYFYFKEKPVHAMLTASLIFIFRTEYYYVAGLLFLIYAYEKQWKVLPYIIAGPVLWYLYTTIITLNPTQFFYDMTLHSRLPKIDVGVDWYFFLMHSPKIYGFIQAICFVSALVILFTRKEIRGFALLIIITFAGIAVQTLLALKGLNLTCSIGQLRYVGVVGPVFGIISAVGFSYFFEKINGKGLQTGFMLVILFLMFVLGPYSTPYHNKYEIEKISDDIYNLQKSQYSDYTVLSNMHQLANAMDLPQQGGGNLKLLTQSNVNNTSKSVIIWCSYLEGTPFLEENVLLKEIESIPGIKFVKEYKGLVNNCEATPVWKHRKEGDEYEFSREFIDYMVADQTAWETIDIRVFVKD
jgi:hypothetical protein